MPNWCSNHLDVFFEDDADARRFEDKISGEDGFCFSMERFFPCPKALKTFMDIYMDDVRDIYMDDMRSDRQFNLSDGARGVVAAIGASRFPFTNVPFLESRLQQWVSGHAETSDAILAEVRQVFDSITGATSQNTAEALAAFLKKTGGYVHSNDWSNNAWGTKWDIDPHGQTVEWDGNHFTATFDTAWNPPFTFFEKLSKEFPNVTFELAYYESGMNFGGVAEFANGSTSYDESDDSVAFAKEKLGWEDDEEACKPVL